MPSKGYEGYEVNGRNLQSIVEAFRFFPEVGLKALAKHGIGTMLPDGRVSLERREWFPLGPWLAAFHEITSTVGPNKMYEIGKQIPKNSVFPPGINDIASALQSCHFAYHMQHRKQGVVMFDPATNKLLDGIGHYRFSMKPGSRKIEMDCENPYPCDMDRGLLTTLALRFEPMAVLQHLDEAICRNRGANRCVYGITW